MFNIISRVLVIGGGGFIGSHLVKALLLNGQYVKILDNRISSIIDQHPNLEWIAGDFGNKQDLDIALKNVDIVYHLVSTTQPQKSNENPAFDIQSNLINTITLLDKVRAIPNLKIIFLSSGGTVYGTAQQTPIPETHNNEPQCSYGIVKLAIEKYFSLYNLLYGINYRILRLANPYGPGQANLQQGVIGAFLLRTLQNKQLEIWGDGTIVRDYIYIKDVIDAIMLASTYNGKTRIFNIGSGSGRNVIEILNVIERVTEKKANVIYIAKREFDVSVSILDISLAEKELGWKPETSFEYGIKETINWIQTQNLSN